MKDKLPYDKSSPKSLEAYAKKLIGHTFDEVEKWDLPSIVREQDYTYNLKSRKGGLGNFIEEKFFCYKANSDSQADFPEAGVELKVTPYEKKKNGKISAGERLVLTMINYEEEVEPDFYKSHVWEKCKLILLIYYLRDRNKTNNMDYRIDYASLFQVPKQDMEIIINDYKIITDKIKNGKAHELSESDTMYLGACTKGSTAEKSWVKQKYNPEQKAKKRAFCLKNSYMTYMLNNYIIPGKVTCEDFITSEELSRMSFPDILKQRLSRYIGMNEDNIVDQLGITLNKNNKSYEATLVYNMLGVKNTHIEEFDKAGILVKVLKYRKVKKNNQQLRLDDIDFIALNEEKMDDEIKDDEGNYIGWEHSSLYNILGNRKYLFAIFWEDDKDCIFKGSQLWAMPEEDLEIVRKVWNRLKVIVKNDIELIPDNDNGKVHNNLPGMSDNGIFHIRPHSSKSYYELKDGSKIGNGKISNSVLLPNGERMTRQAYWLNRSYIDKQIDSELRKEYE